MTKTRPGAHADMYLAAIRYELADVPWRRREDLLATVTERLGELPDTTVPATELGSPRDFARDLRDSAGLPPKRRTPYTLFAATRRRTKIKVAVSLLTIVVVTTALVARAHYQPVTADVMFGAGNAQSITDNLVTNVDYYRYRQGALIVRGLQIRNNGWAPVTVDGFAVENAPNLITLREMRGTTSQLVTPDWTRVPKIKHLTIPGGKTGYVYMVLKLLPFTIGKGAYMSFALPDMHVRILGVHHSVTVGGNQIGVLSPQQ